MKVIATFQTHHRDLTGKTKRFDGLTVWPWKFNSWITKIEDLENVFVFPVKCEAISIFVRQFPLQMLFQKSLSWILDKESKSHCGGSTSQIFTAYVPKGARSKFNTSRLIIFPHHKILTSDYQTYSIMIIIFLLEVPGNATRSCLSSLLKEVSVCNGNGTAHLKSPRAKKSQNSQIWMSCWVVVTYIYIYIMYIFFPSR